MVGHSSAQLNHFVFFFIVLTVVYVFAGVQADVAHMVRQQLELL